MDELEFRRRAITHPSDRDPAFLKAAEASPANRKHLDEMQQLESAVTRIRASAHETSKIVVHLNRILFFLRFDARGMARNQGA